MQCSRKDAMRSSHIFNILLCGGNKLLETYGSEKWDIILSYTRTADIQSIKTLPDLQCYVSIAPSDKYTAHYLQAIANRNSNFKS